MTLFHTKPRTQGAYRAMAALAALCTLVPSSHAQESTRPQDEPPTSALPSPAPHLGQSIPNPLAGEFHANNEIVYGEWEGEPLINGIPRGFKVIEGDIVVPEDFDTSTRATYAANLWPGGVVPYEFDANVTPANAAAMLVAMAQWEAIANVDFRPRAGELLYVHIRNATENNSGIGMQPVPYNINIVNWDYRFIMAHELGHALGYWHEQSRADRDIFIQVNFGNIQPGMEFNFWLRVLGGEYGPYDFDSVMHYNRCAFSQCCPPGSSCDCPQECQTITVLPPNDVQWHNAIGQRTHLSAWDVRVMSFLYPQSNWRFVDNVCGTRGWVCPACFQDGGFGCPYAVNATETLQGAVNATPEGGTLWILSAASYKIGGGGTLTKPMTLRAPLGATLIP